jgi:hypothetical protein
MAALKFVHSFTVALLAVHSVNDPIDLFFFTQFMNSETFLNYFKKAVPIFTLYNTVGGGMR